jgi:hypothetical protein
MPHHIRPTKNQESTIAGHNNPQVKKPAIFLLESSGPKKPEIRTIKNRISPPVLKTA